VAAAFECFQHSKGGEGVVRRVEKLSRSEFRGSPVAGGYALGFPEPLLEHRADGRADADLAFEAPLSEVVVEIDQGAERDAQGGAHLAQIIPQAEADF
jgi:hypothetical protein